ncbi:hypothetical protein CWD78_05395 [Dickeya dadantii]|nr:hypothetical protein [Dickeya dadantii]
MLYPKQCKLQENRKRVNPDELTQVSDLGERQIGVSRFERSQHTCNVKYGGYNAAAVPVI